jgi:hypothetical protein
MKKFYKSKTIWGAIISILPTLAPLLGLSTNDIHMIGQSGDNLIQFAGVVLAIYGRVKANGEIKIF